VTVAATRTEEIADLSTLGAGATAEKFAAELRAVLENIRDPNTDPKAKRKISLEFVFHPAEDRETVMVSITTKSTLGKTKPAGDVMYVGKHEGELVGTVVHGPGGEVLDPRQGVLSLKKGG
jgi:hypothetical protein